MCRGGGPDPAGIRHRERAAWLLEVPRPAIPAAFWALVVCVAVIRAVLRAGGAPKAAVPVVACVGAALTATLALRGKGSAAAAVGFLAAAAACGAAVAGVELRVQGRVCEALGTSPVSAWELELTTDMGAGATGWRGRARATGPDGAAGTVWLVADEPVDLGARLRCVGRFSPNAADDWGVSSRMQGVAGTVRVVRVGSVRQAEGPRGLLLAFRRAVLLSFGPEDTDARAVLAGSVCGTASSVAERGLDDAFAATGTSHLVAVSGGHLVVVASVVGSLMAHTRLRPWARAAATLALTAGFVAFCGAPVSAVRSWAMAAVAELAGLAGRRGHTASAVSVVALVMALMEPGSTGQLGYLLSVACVCGIALFGGYATAVVRVLGPGERAWRRLPAPLVRPARHAWESCEEALALTLVSQAATLPLTLPVFGELSLVAPAANVALAPLFSALISLGLVAVCLVWAPALQAAVLAAADAVGAVLVWVLGLLAGVPFASVALSVGEAPALVALVVGAGLLLAVWPRPSRRAVLGLLAAMALAGAGWFVRWRVFAPARVCVLDVGQADAILVGDGAAAVLVDAGADGRTVDALARNHVYHLDAVVVTHLHADHVGGLDEVLGSVGVGRVLVAEGVEPEVPAGTKVERLAYGDELVVGGFRLRAVSPVGPVDGTQNEHSLELALSYGAAGRSLTGLLTGDAESDMTAAAVGRGDVGDVDFLKVGHHGSAASIDEGTARALDPEVSVASAGEGNSYGHPTEECVRILTEAGSLFLCTKDVGDVTVEPGAGGPVVGTGGTGN